MRSTPQQRALRHQLLLTPIRRCSKIGPRMELHPQPEHKKSPTFARIEYDAGTLIFDAKTHFFAKIECKVEFAKCNINCKLRDSKRSIELLKYLKRPKKGHLDFGKKCCIFVLQKGRPRGFPFFRAQKWQKQPQRLLKQGPMLLKLPPMLFSRSPML